MTKINAHAHEFWWILHMLPLFALKKEKNLWKSLSLCWYVVVLCLRIRLLYHLKGWWAYEACREIFESLCGGRIAETTRRGPGEHKQGALILGSMQLCFACLACSVVGWICLTTWESVSVPSRFYSETDSRSSSLTHGGICEMVRRTNQHRSLYWKFMRILPLQQHSKPPFHALSCEDLQWEIKAVQKGLLPFVPCRHGSFVTET